jgi:hypothetical protein
MTADVELLPCPWCGEKLASVSVSEGSTFRWRKVDGCCTDGPEVRHDTMADDQAAAEAESRAAAIAAWNRRANVTRATTPLQAEIEALRDLCGMAYQLAGVHDAPEKWLDALSNASAGRPFSTDGLLPYIPQASD